MPVDTLAAASMEGSNDEIDPSQGRIAGGKTGRSSGYPAPTVPPGFRNLDPRDHDNVSSWANRTRFQYCLYDNGSSVLLDVRRPGQGRAGMRPGSNDRADSIGRC